MNKNATGFTSCIFALLASLLNQIGVIRNREVIQIFPQWYSVLISSVKYYKKVVCFILEVIPFLSVCVGGTRTYDQRSKDSNGQSENTAISSSISLEVEVEDEIGKKINANKTHKLNL